MLADPAGRERVPPIKGEVSAGVRRIEELRGGLRFVLGDEDDVRAGGLCVGTLRAASLGNSVERKRRNRCQAHIDQSQRGCPRKVCELWSF